MKIDNIYILFLKKSPLPCLPLKIVQEAARTALFAARREKGPFISQVVNGRTARKSILHDPSPFSLNDAGKSAAKAGSQNSFDGFRMPFASKAFLMPRINSIFSGA